MLQIGFSRMLRALSRPKEAATSADKLIVRIWPRGGLTGT